MANSINSVKEFQQFKFEDVSIRFTISELSVLSSVCKSILLQAHKTKLPQSTVEILVGIENNINEVIRREGYQCDLI
jgi:hypothetical protein